MSNDLEEYWQDRREVRQEDPLPKPKEPALSRRDLRGIRPDFPEAVYQVIHNTNDGLDRIELWELRVEEDCTYPFGGKPIPCWRASYHRRLWHGGTPRARDAKELRRRYVFRKRDCHLVLEDALQEIRQKAAECAQRELYNVRSAEQRRDEFVAAVTYHEERLRIARNFEISTQDLDLSPEQRGQLKLF